MLIVLALLIVDYLFSRKSPQNPRSLLIRTQNTCDTVLIYSLLLYILYVFSMNCFLENMFLFVYR